MDAVGARAEERHGTPVEAEHRRRTPARRDVKSLVAPFRDPLFGNQRVDDGVDCAADHFNIAAGKQVYLVVGDREDIRKSPQRCGIVTPQQPHSFVPGKERHRARGVVIVAGNDMVAERHGSQAL